MDRRLMTGAVIVAFLLLAFASQTSYAATGHAYWLVIALVSLGLSTVTGAVTAKASS